MKRLKKFDIGGIPYVNSDFTEILQTEHLKCYGGLLDSMNQDTYTGRNSGIILKGCDIISSNSSSYQMKFINSMVYLNGEFYEYNYSTTSNVSISSSTFYLYAMATSSQTRYLRNLTTTASVTETNYFTWSSSEPATGQYIKFSSQGTSRRYKRILKYFSSNYGDIYISSTTQSFSATGLGFNDMEGFLILNDQNSLVPDFSGKFLRSRSVLEDASDFYNIPETGMPQSIFDQYNSDLANATSGEETYQIVKDFSTNYLNYFQAESQRITSLGIQPKDPKTLGFKKMFEEDGTSQVSLDLTKTPTHNHFMLPTTFSMDHSHVFHTTQNHSPFVKDSSGTNRYLWAVGGGEDPIGVYNQGQNKFTLTQSPVNFTTNFMRAIQSSLVIPPLNILSVSTNTEQQMNLRPVYTYTFGVSSRSWRPLTRNSGVLLRYYPKYSLSGERSSDEVYRTALDIRDYLSMLNQSPEPEPKPVPNLLSHTHSIQIGSEGFGSNTADAHENRPAYRVMVYYTKIYRPIPITTIQL
jgi:hypothetical protein